MYLRTLETADLEAVLELNQGALDGVTSLDRARLEEILALADSAVVADDAGKVAGFAITLASGSAYDSTNYRWFADRYDDFAYLDRVVVSPDHRRRGVATLIYDSLERSAAACGRMALEVNIEPPNRPSLDFHAARGYAEVGRLAQDDGKVCGMLVKPLG